MVAAGYKTARVFEPSSLGPVSNSQPIAKGFLATGCIHANNKWHHLKTHFACSSSSSWQPACTCQVKVKVSIFSRSRSRDHSFWLSHRCTAGSSHNITLLIYLGLLGGRWRGVGWGVATGCRLLQLMLTANERRCLVTAEVVAQNRCTLLLACTSSPDV